MKKVKVPSILGSLLLCLMVSGWSAHSLEKGSQFGLMGGMSVPDAENTRPYKLFGAKGSATVTPTFSVGGYYLVSDKSGEPSAEDQFRYSLHGIQVAYHLTGNVGDTFVALRLGLTKVKGTPEQDVSVTYSPYHYGVATGYDFYITSWASIGFEGSYLHAQRGKTSYEGTTYRLDSFNIISFLISIQIRL